MVTRSFGSDPIITTSLLTGFSKLYVLLPALRTTEKECWGYKNSLIESRDERNMMRTHAMQMNRVVRSCICDARKNNFNRFTGLDRENRAYSGSRFD